MRYLVLILFILILALNVKALAVASDYLENNTLVLTEGTSAIYSIRLQNTDTYEVRYKVDYDQQFMKAVDYKEEYIVAPKSSQRIEFNLTAPRYDMNNNVFVIGYTVHQLTGAAGGGIPFLTKINRNFKLKVAKKPSPLNVDYYQLGYLIILLVIAFVLLRKISSKVSKEMPTKKKNK